MKSILPQLLAEINSLSYNTTITLKTYSGKDISTIKVQLSASQTDGTTGFDCPEFFIHFKPNSSYIDKYLQIFEKASERGVHNISGKFYPTGAEFSLNMNLEDFS